MSLRVHVRGKVGASARMSDCVRMLFNEAESDNNRRVSPAAVSPRERRFINPGSAGSCSAELSRTGSECRLDSARYESGPCPSLPSLG